MTGGSAASRKTLALQSSRQEEGGRVEGRGGGSGSTGKEEAPG